MMKRSLVSFFVILSLLGWGCRGIRERILESALDEETITEETITIVKEHISAIEAGEESLDTSGEIEEATDALAPQGDPSSGFSFSLAPGLSEMATASQNCQSESSRYSRGRVKNFHRECSYTQGPVTETVDDLSFQWSSSPGGSGDLNETLPSPSYVSTTVLSLASFRGATAGPARLQGFREWHTDPRIHYLNFDLTLTLPDLPRVPFRSLHWYGGFPTEQIAGIQYGGFTREVVLKDGNRDTRTWELSLSGTTLAVEYRRTSTGGFSATGEGTLDTRGTRCRRDDEGTFTLTRNFPQDTTTAVQPISEVVVITQRENTIEEKGTLYLSDGTTRNRSAIRTIVSPAQCGDNDLPWTESVTRTSYRGVTVQFTLTRTTDGVTITGTRTLPSGGVQNFTIVRTSNGITTVSATAQSQNGKVVELELVISPSGHAGGTVTITDPDGTVDIIEISRDLKGYKLHRLARPLNEFRRINRGEL
jgi:hypothetical protein